ncbi:DUF349 domain-containing protein [Alloscardovia venturai]|uniref:DUF349 domain-containing protein n=1 Tax=Alloscardovia venturai TaxID=1769421 RepID=A0ABW2Y5B6_9BIFI
MSQDNATTPTPSPAAFAHMAAGATMKNQAHVSTYGDADLEAAKVFGRIADDGTVFVKDNGEEREIGQFADVENKDEALNLYARRYLDLKAKIDHARARFASSTIKTREIDETLESLIQEVQAPAIIGDLESVRASVESLKAFGNQAKEKIAQAHEAAVKAALAQRTTIVEEAEKLTASLGESTNWRNTGEKFNDLFVQWQNAQKTGARLDKKTADALWSRFSKARNTFNAQRRAWIAARDTARGAAREAKKAIIAQAEELKNSTDWGETSRKFTALMNDWKKAGRVGQIEDDNLWKQFRAAADTFFDARQADRDQMNAVEKENLAQKEALVAKAEALLPVNDIKAAKTARAALARIQDEWDTIGRVPRADVARIESRMDAVEKQIKQVEDSEWTRTDPEANARKSSFEEQLTAQLTQLDEKISTESDPHKKAQLQAERDAKAQWLAAVK